MDNSKSSAPRFTAYIGNLAYNAVPGDIESLFEGLAIKAVNLVHDRETNQFRGYAYADFETEQDLDVALQRDKTMVLEREVSVQLPKPKAPRTNTRPPRTQGNASGGGGDRNYSNEVPENPPFKAFIGNFTYETDEANLREFLTGLSVKEVKMVHDKETGEPKGHAYVEFDDRESLTQVLTANNQEFNGRMLKIYVATQGNKAEGGYNNSNNRGFPGRNQTEQSAPGGKDPFFRSYNNSNRPQRRAPVAESANVESEVKAPPAKTEGGEEVVTKIDKSQLTIEPTNKDKPKKEDIFGTAKPRDEFEYQKRLQKLEAKTGGAQPEPKKQVETTTEKKVPNRPAVARDTNKRTPTTSNNTGGKGVQEDKEKRSPAAAKVDDGGFTTVTKKHVK